MRKGEINSWITNRQVHGKGHGERQLNYEQIDSCRQEEEEKLPGKEKKTIGPS